MGVSLCLKNIFRKLLSLALLKSQSWIFLLKTNCTLIICGTKNYYISRDKKIYLSQSGHRSSPCLIQWHECFIDGYVEISPTKNSVVLVCAFALLSNYSVILLSSSGCLLECTVNPSLAFRPAAQVRIHDSALIPAFERSVVAAPPCSRCKSRVGRLNR